MNTTTNTMRSVVRRDLDSDVSEAGCSVMVSGQRSCKQASTEKDERTVLQIIPRLQKGK